MVKIILSGNPEEINNRHTIALLHDNGTMTIKVWDAGEKEYTTISLIKEESDKLIQKIKSM